jgi:putative membrane protein
MEVANSLAALNACLNGASAVCIFLGWRAIEARQQDRHKKLMLAAVTFSGLFLASYLTRFALSGAHRYPVDDWTRTLYLTILTSHTILAATVPFLVFVAVRRALKGQLEKHRAVVKYALPIWGYVSVTGVVIYLMLYHLGPSRL